MDEKAKKKKKEIVQFIPM